MPAFGDPFGEKIGRPDREIAFAYKFVVLSNRIVRHDKAAFDNVDKIGLCVCFQHFEQRADFQSVILSRPITANIVSV